MVCMVCIVVVMIVRRSIVEVIGNVGMWNGEVIV